MFTIGIYFLSSISLLKNRILTSFLHLPQKSAYNIFSVKKKNNEKKRTRYILSNNNGNKLFLQMNNE